ncbi:MAG: hypothetical protein B6244_08095 [Candidatus Cloacimonetes bacterium 4572_55]|nr:MAG: hypothetical protein B6244_08095 [Candidatus Cloacimonetes bacterium 4572_55]
MNPRISQIMTSTKCGQYKPISHVFGADIQILYKNFGLVNNFISNSKLNNFKKLVVLLFDKKFSHTSKSFLTM